MATRARRLALLVPLLGTMGGTAAAQTRPLLTETAATAPAGSLVFETGFDLVAREPSYVTGVERTRWDGPLLRLTYSPADDVELDLDWVARLGVIGEAGRGDVASSDFGDITLRAKWRFARGGGKRPALAARFGVVLPETSFDDEQFNPLGLGPNTLRAFVEALAAQPVGRGRVLLNLGFLVHDEVYRPHDQRDFLTYGLALEWPVAARLTAAAEVNGRTGDGERGADVRSEARAGLRLAAGAMRFDAAVRRGIATADGTWGFTVGFGWTARTAR